MESRWNIHGHYPRIMLQNSTCSVFQKSCLPICITYLSACRPLCAHSALQFHPVAVISSASRRVRGDASPSCGADLDSGVWLLVTAGYLGGCIEQESNVDSHQKNRMGNRVIQVYPPFKNPLMRWPVSSDFPHKLSQGMN